MKCLGVIGSSAMAGRVLWNRVSSSVLQSVYKFSRNLLISFFWNLAWCLGHVYSCDRAGFPQKNLHWERLTKNDQKWPQNRVFGLYKKIKSLTLSVIGVKRKFLWFINILWKLHAWKKSGSQVMVKNEWLLANEISVFLNYQYFINRLIFVM